MSLEVTQVRCVFVSSPCATSLCLFRHLVYSYVRGLCSLKSFRNKEAARSICIGVVDLQPGCILL